MRLGRSIVSLGAARKKSRGDDVYQQVCEEKGAKPQQGREVN